MVRNLQHPLTLLKYSYDTKKVPHLPRRWIELTLDLTGRPIIHFVKKLIGKKAIGDLRAEWIVTANVGIKLCVQSKPQELDVIIFLFFLGLALLRFCKRTRPRKKRKIITSSSCGQNCLQWRQESRRISKENLVGSVRLKVPKCGESKWTFRPIAISAYPVW